MFSHHLLSKWKCLLRLLKLGVMVTSFALFLFQTINSIDIFMNRKKFLVQKIQKNGTIPFPKVTLCPAYPFVPSEMIKLGIDVKNLRHHLYKKLKSLQDINGSMTTRDLHHLAGWKLGSLLEMTQVGDVSEVYDISSSSSKFWEPSFNFLYPCFTFDPSKLKNNFKSIILKRRKHFGIEPCTWFQDGKIKHYEGYFDCSNVEKYCNTSCSEENIIGEKSLRVLVQGIMTSDYSPNLLPFNRFLGMHFEGSYELHPYSINLISNQRYNYDWRKCIEKCIKEGTFKEENCNYFDYVENDFPVNTLCIDQPLGEYFKYMKYECSNQCPVESVSVFWKIFLEDSNEVFNISFILDPITYVTEYETYTSAKLISDIGGNLGLLLGISFFSFSVDLGSVMIDILSRVLKSLRNGNWLSGQTLAYRASLSLTDKYKFHLKTLLTYSLTLAWLCLMIISLSSLLGSYIGQKEHVVVSMEIKNYKSSTSATSGLVSLQNWIYGYIASHSLGCRVIPSDEYNQCLQNCALKALSDQNLNILPYTLSDNLPLCSETLYRYYSIDYTVPDIPLLLLPEDETICSRTCSRIKSNHSQYFTAYPTPKIEIRKSMSVIQLICSISGIVGLYFGISIMDCQDLVIDPLIVKLTRNELLSKISKLLLFCIVGILCITITSQQIYLFFFHKPALSSSSVSTIDGDTLPAISLCSWPPTLNFSFLAGEDITDIDEQKKSLMLYFQTHKSDAQDLSFDWDRIWSNEDSVYCSDYGLQENNGKNNVVRKSSASHFGRCITCIPKPSIEDFLHIDNVIKTYCVIMVKSSYKRFLVQVHDRSSSIFWSKLEFDERVIFTDLVGVDIMSFDYFKPARSQGYNYSDCMNDCFISKLNNDFCFHDAHLCAGSNATDLHSFTDLIFNLTEAGSSTKMNKLFKPSYVSECSKVCESTDFMSMKSVGRFLYHSKEYRSKSSLFGKLTWTSGSKASFCVYVHVDTSESREETFSYSSTQLMSDIGGVISFTTGTSLMVLLLYGLKKFDQWILKIGR